MARIGRILGGWRAALTCAACVGALAALAGGVSECVSFVDGKALIRNPGCGLAGGGWSTVKTNALVSVNITQPNATKLWSLHPFSQGYVYSSYDYYLLHVYGFVGGRDLPLNDWAIASITNGFESCRRNGGTVIPRFAYTWDGWGGCEPADFGMVLHHIRQLAEICSRYRDVIPAVECGIIGAYGEMHTSSYAGRSHASRVTSAWLDGLPEDMGLLVRSPCYILYESGLDTTAELLASSAASSARLMRMGFYNDGYLGTDADYGTWGSGSTMHFTRSQGRAFLKPRALPYGGEFATVTDDYFDQNVHLLDPARHNIVEEWYDTHLSYLRTIESTGMTVYQKLAATTFDPVRWAFDGMPDLSEYAGETMQKFCEDHMGYRYVVRGVTVVRSGATCRIDLTVENTGFGQLLFPETKEILLTRGGVTRTVPASGTDLRLLRGGETSAVSVSFEWPADLPHGAYATALRVRVPLADEDGTLPPRRVVAFANDGGYDAASKANRLCTIDFDGDSDTETEHDWSLGGTVFAAPGVTTDLRGVFFDPSATLVVAGGGTVVLGASSPSAVEIDGGRLVLTGSPDDYDFSTINAHGHEVTLLNEGAEPRTAALDDPRLAGVTLAGEWRYVVPEGVTCTIAEPRWIDAHDVEVYGTLDVRATLTLAGSTTVTVHAGGTMGNLLATSATSGAAKMIVRDRASIVVDGGALVNPVNGNWDGSGLELATNVDGHPALVVRGGRVALHRMSGTGQAAIEVRGDARWEVWYGEWYGNDRCPYPFKGASVVRIAEGATLTVTRIRASGWSNQQDGGDITVDLADVPIDGDGDLVFTNDWPERRVTYRVSSVNGCRGRVSCVEGVNAQLTFVEGAMWSGEVLVTDNVTMPRDWWFSADVSERAAIGGGWLADEVDGEGRSVERFAFDHGIPPGCDGTIVVSVRAGFLLSLPATDRPAFACLSERGRLAPYGHASGGWRRLRGPELTEGSYFTLTMSLARSASDGGWTVTYAADGEAFVDEDGHAALPMALPAQTLAGIDFVGEGTHGDFKGVLTLRPKCGFRLILR